MLKKISKEAIITIISGAICFIVFCILKVIIRGSMSVASGGEMFILVIPLVIYVVLKNWELFIELCFPKDTMFEDYFDEYFTGKDMMEEESSDIIDINDFITR